MSRDDKQQTDPEWLIMYPNMVGCSVQTGGYMGINVEKGAITHAISVHATENIVLQHEKRHAKVQYIHLGRFY